VFTISLCTPQSEEETSLCSLSVYVLHRMSEHNDVSSSLCGVHKLIVNTMMSPPHSVEYID
jgi:hypothetical protein